MVHTNKIFAELQWGYRWGCELLSAQKNRGGQEMLACRFMVYRVVLLA